MNDEVALCHDPAPTLGANLIRYSIRPGILGLAAAWFCLTGCASPEPRPLESAALTASVEERSTRTAERLAETLAEIKIGPSALGSPKADATPSDVAFWRAATLAWNPEVRRARRNLEGAMGRRISAGAPRPIGLGGGAIDGEMLVMGEAQATVDLIGLFGLEPAAAAKALAQRRVERALAELEDAVWLTRFELDIALLRWVMNRERIAALEILREEAEGDLRRIELLLERGRLGRGIVERARAMVFGLQDRIQILETQRAGLREALARVTGLASTHAAFDAMVEFPESELSTAALAAPDAARLYESLPALRSARRNYAVAEAQLRVAAAESWPRLRVGPQFRIGESVLPGGLIGLEVPFPGSWEGGVAAAHAEREAARERLEDLLLQSINAAKTQAAVADRRRRSSTGPARGRDLASSRAWQAARAAASVHERYVERWIDAFESRGPSLLASIQAREDHLIATIRLAALTGPSEAEMKR